MDMRGHDIRERYGKVFVDGLPITEEAQEKIDYIREKFGLSLDQIFHYSHMLTIPIYGQDNPESLEYKFNFYTRAIGATKATFRKNPVLIDLDCSKSGSPTSVRKKIEYLFSLGLGMSDIRNAPLILSLDCDPNSTTPTSIRSKIEHLQKMGIGKKAYIKYPIILCMDCNPDSKNPTSVAQKMAFLAKEFNFSGTQIDSFPRLLGLDCSYSLENPASLLRKRDFYINELGLTLESLAKFPHILGYDCDKNSTEETNIPHKIAQAEACGIDLKIFRQMPLILGAPTEAIKVRYMIYKVSGIEKAAPNASIFIQNEQKSYARLQHLRAIKSTNFRAVAFDEPKFNKRIGANSLDLIEKYPLNEEAYAKLEQEYLALKEAEQAREKAQEKSE